MVVRNYVTFLSTCKSRWSFLENILLQCSHLCSFVCSRMSRCTPLICRFRWSDRLNSLPQCGHGMWTVSCVRLWWKIVVFQMRNLSGSSYIADICELSLQCNFSKLLVLIFFKILFFIKIRCLDLDFKESTIFL